LNGYFLGTCFDGNEIFKFLYKRHDGTLIQKNESVRIDKNQRKMFEITKKYDAMIDSFPTDASSVGMPILVYQESIDKQFMEYLVNFEYFTRLMDDYGFVLMDTKEASSMGFHHSSGLFDRLYGSMKHDIKKEDNNDNLFRNAPNMSSAEKTVSFLNRYFIFKKVREMSQNTLNQMQNILEKEETNELDDERITENEEVLEEDGNPENDENVILVPEEEPKTVQKNRKSRKKMKDTKVVLNDDIYSPDNEEI